MKKLLLSFILLFVFTGCNSNSNEKKETKERFLEKNFINYPDVENIVSYLGIEKESATILSQSNKHLMFCIKVDDVDVHDESIVSYANYIKNLESKGYQLKIYDATISQTFELQDSNYIVSITLITDINNWKKEHKDLENIDKITNQNLLYKIEKIAD